MCRYRVGAWVLDPGPAAVRLVVPQLTLGCIDTIQSAVDRSESAHPFACGCSDSGIPERERVAGTG
jgi:hypothetical protein